jgi:hypothetical protein
MTLCSALPCTFPLKILLLSTGLFTATALMILLERRFASCLDCTDLLIILFYFILFNRKKNKKGNATGRVLGHYRLYREVMWSSLPVQPDVPGMFLRLCLLAQSNKNRKTINQ